MKKLIATLLALVTSASLAATTVPVQLINPTGSTAGQAIVSNGASSAPSWGAVSGSSLAAQAANTVLANVTGSSASPTAFAMPSCSAGGNNLQYTIGTGFTCATGYAQLASPTFTGTVGAANIAATGSLSAGGNDALLYTSTAGQSIPSGTQTTVTTWTKVFDRVNANFNATTGVFTAPATGFYHVAAGVFYAGSANTVANLFQAIVVANGANACLGASPVQTTSTIAMDAVTSCIVSLTAGQTIVLQAFQNSGSARSLGGTAAATYISIHRVP